MNDSAPRETPKPLLVLIAGPYLSGTGGDTAKAAANRTRLESCALRGADLDVARARELGLPVYADASELPQRAASADGAAR